MFFDYKQKKRLCEYNYDHKYFPKVNHLCVSESNKTLLVCYENDDIIALDISKVPTGEVKQKWRIVKAHKGKITCAFLNEKFLLTGNDDGLLRIWHSENQKLIHELNYHKGEITMCSALKEKPHIIVSAAKDKNVVLFDLMKEKRLNNFMLNNGFVNHIVFLTEDTLISSGFNTPVSFWKSGSIAPVEEIKEVGIKKMSLSPEKKHLALLSYDNHLKVYELGGKKKVHESRLNYMEVDDIWWTTEGIVGVDRSGAYYLLS